MAKRKTSKKVAVNIYYNKLNPKAFGLACGFIFALYMLILGLAAAWLGWGTNLVGAIGTLYIGYGATFFGSIIGALWAFVDGLVAGLIFAWLYNLFIK